MKKIGKPAKRSGLRYHGQTLLIVVFCFGAIVAVNAAWIWYAHISRNETAASREW